MINILYAGNYKVFDGLLLSILSMLKHTNETLNIKCLTMDLSDIQKRFVPISKEQEKYIQKLVKEKNPENTFNLIDVTKIFRENLINSVNINNSFTPYAMVRLVAHKVEGIPDKFIYLDVDTMINRDIALLYNNDVEDYELAVVKDAYNWTDIRRWGKKYFNAGVMLVNMKKCKETGLFENAMIMVRDKKMLYMDQEALNNCVKKKKMLPLIFNSKNKYYKDIVVHHFCDVRESRVFLISKKWWHRIKPWEVDFVKQKMSAYNDILDDYLARKADPKFPIVKIEE